MQVSKFRVRASSFETGEWRLKVGVEFQIREDPQRGQGRKLSPLRVVCRVSCFAAVRVAGRYEMEIWDRNTDSNMELEGGATKSCWLRCCSNSDCDQYKGYFLPLGKNGRNLSLDGRRPEVSATRQALGISVSVAAD